MDRRAAIWALAVTQTLGYACLYYIFAALVVRWQDDLGWSKPALALGPTCAIVLAGCMAPFVGRLIDKGWSRALLSGGSVIGAIGLALLATTTTQSQYIAAWMLIGVAQGTVLYEVCFAFLIRRLGPDARAAIIRVTLVAGFASTLAFPVAASVSQAYGWRAAVWLAFGVVIAVQLPLNWRAVTTLRRGEIHQTTEDNEAGNTALWRALRSVRFWLLGMVLALLSLNHWMMIAFIIPVFTSLGATMPEAIFAASIVGPAQVIGRLVLMRLETRANNWSVMTACLSGMAFGIGALALSGVTSNLIFIYALAQGGAIGVMTIMRPILISDVMGQAGYGAIAGGIQVMPLLAGAAAPLVAGLLFAAGGAGALIGLSAALIALGFAGSLMLRRL